MANLSKTTQDHDEIRSWAEERGGKPSHVASTGSGDDVGILRIDFPGFSGEGSLEEISWDDWFEKFDESNLALIYEDVTADGERSNFNKLVSAATAAASGTKKKSSAKKKAAPASAKKAAATKAPAKKTIAKKMPPTKTAAKKTVAKKTVAKKASPKKVAPKKAAPKKATAKKAPAKKTAAKKAVSKNVATKKRR